MDQEKFDRLVAEHRRKQEETMGSTDPKGEGDRKVASTQAYDARLEEYRKKLAESADEAERLQSGTVRPDPLAEMIQAAVKLGPVLAKYAPLFLKFAPLIAMGLRKSADQLDAVASVSKAFSPPESVQYDPTVHSGAVVHGEPIENVRATYGKPTVLDRLAERFGDLQLDMSDQPERHSRGEMIRVWHRWLDDLDTGYRGTADKLEWIGDGVPEFIPSPTEEVPNRWIRNPAYDASGFTTLSVVPESGVQVNEVEADLVFGDGTTVKQRVGQVVQPEGYVDASGFYTDVPTHIHTPDGPMEVPTPRWTGIRELHGGKAPAMGEFTQEQINEYLDSADLEVGEEIDLENVRRYFEMKGFKDDGDRTGNEIREREKRDANPREG